MLLKLFDRNQNNSKYGETFILIETNYDVIHKIRKGISTRFGPG